MRLFRHLQAIFEDWFAEIFIVAFLAGMVLLMFGFAPNRAYGQEAPDRSMLTEYAEWQWEKAHDVTDVVIVEQVADDMVLRAMYREWIQPVPEGALVAGLAILYPPIEEGGAWRCEILLAWWADESDRQHEIRHCYGWIHQ